MHKLLNRQLIKTGLSVDALPSLKAWQDFLLRVDKAYAEADQERYLQERSMNISSKEMMFLNTRLESAQHIARLGYWNYDYANDSLAGSKELFRLLGTPPTIIRPPRLDEFLKLVYKKDNKMILPLLQQAIQESQDFECEVRVKTADSYRWFKVIAECHPQEKQINGVMIDVHSRKAAEQRINELNQQFLQTARRAGMAEVATMVLHNIGNILNSATISIDILKTIHKKYHHEKLLKVIELLMQHADLREFLKNDQKGRLLSDYIEKLSKIILVDENNNIEEIENLIQGLEHIEKIVAMQNMIGGISSLIEQIYPPELIETALKMSFIEKYDQALTITQDIAESPLIETDKSKLLQILVNLLQNARESVFKNKDNLSNEIKLAVKKYKKNAIQISVEDNGIGIAPHEISRIFSYGFTTKESGHGFGLHSSALSAQEMGGTLNVQSPGLGQGATFTLTLPIKNKSSAKEFFNE